MDKISKYQATLLVILMSLFNAPLFSQEVASACGHHDYPPWNWSKNKKIVGVCAEVTEKLFANIGVKVDLTYIGPWKRCQKNIEASLIDINICSFMTPKRQNYSEYIATPMGYNENAIFVKKGREFQFTQWSDLNGKVGVMMRGVSIGKDFDNFLEQNIQVQRVNNNKQVFGLLELERADFTPYGRYAGIAFLQSLNMRQQFTILDKPVVQGKLYISMSKHSKYLHLLPEIEALMQEPTYSEWVAQLIKKYTDIYANDISTSQKLLPPHIVQ